MARYLTEAEINSVFASMDLPLIERGIEEIRNAKERFGASPAEPEPAVVVQRVIVTNGTGRPLKEGEKHAELEPSPL